MTLNRENDDQFVEGYRAAMNGAAFSFLFCEAWQAGWTLYESTAVARDVTRQMKRDGFEVWE